MCSMFRNESTVLSSTLVTEAVAVTCSIWPVPPLGMVTFIDPRKVRRKRDFGRCFRKAGFVPVGHTKGGLVALQLLPERMPAAFDPLPMVQMYYPLIDKVSILTRLGL